MNFIKEEFRNLIKISLNFVWQYIGISSGNDLAPNNGQAVIWNNDDLVYWRV